MYRAGASSFSIRVASGTTAYSIEGVSNLIYLFFSGSADNEKAIAKENRSGTTNGGPIKSHPINVTFQLSYYS